MVHSRVVIALESCTRLVKLFGACSAWGAYAELDARALREEILSDDSECLAGSDPSYCSLAALQLRTRTLPEVAVRQFHEARVAELAVWQLHEAQAWQQCGGMAGSEQYSGPTNCTEGYNCTEKDEYYSQCLPAGTNFTEPTHAPESGDLPNQTAKEMPKLKPNPPTPEPPTLNRTLNPIVVKGNYLYDAVTGRRWFSKGTSYNPRDSRFNAAGRSKGTGCQPGDAKYTGYGTDIIADEFEDRWSEDLEAIANLGANTVRLFNVDAGKDHTRFMRKAASLGIYVIVPLNSKDYGFLPAFPSPRCYTENMTFEVIAADGTRRPYGNVGVNVLSYGKQIVKQFSKFDNTLFFTVNNEFAMHDNNGFAGYQCVKALTRDIHQYQRSCSASMRRVPLIYSDFDMGSPDRAEIAKYLSCALESEDDAIDVYGLNAYSYCSKAYPGGGLADNFDYSPYSDVKKDFQDLSIPMLFTELGCIEGDFLSFCPYEGGRTWPDMKWFFGPEMGEIISGAIAYTYEQDYEERGMVLTPGFLKGQDKLYLLDNYYALQKQFRSHNVSTKWDGADITDCNWTPDKAAPQIALHRRPTCPSSSAGAALMKRRHTDNVTDWHVLPETPYAPLSRINGQSECPADEVDPLIAQEMECHWGDANATIEG